jgi:hypothetical protein
MTETKDSPAEAEHGEDGHPDDHGDHGHGEIHMPPNSWAPISMAFALCTTFIGFVTAPLGPVLWIIGLVWVVASGVAWFRGARNEFHELPD